MGRRRAVSPAAVCVVRQWYQPSSAFCVSEEGAGAGVPEAVHCGRLTPNVSRLASQAALARASQILLSQKKNKKTKVRKIKGRKSRALVVA